MTTCAALIVCGTKVRTIMLRLSANTNLLRRNRRNDQVLGCTQHPPRQSHGPNSYICYYPTSKVPEGNVEHEDAWNQQHSLTHDYKTYFGKGIGAFGNSSVLWDAMRMSSNIKHKHMQEHVFTHTHTNARSNTYIPHREQ